MEVLQTIILVLVIYLSIILLISCITAVFSMRRGKKNAKRVFKDVFWSFFTELINPSTGFKRSV